MKRKRATLIGRVNNEKTIIVLIAAVFILLSVYLYIITQVPVRGLSYNKQLSLQIHEQIQGILKDAKQSSPSIDYIDLNNPEEAYNVQAYYSMLADIEWLAEKENGYYEEMQKASAEKEELKLIKKEIACGVVIQYILILNVAVAEDYRSYEEGKLNLLIEEALIRINNIKEPYLNKEILEDIASYSGLKVSEVEEQIKELIEEYIKLRKKALSEATKSGDKKRQYIEAKKLLMLAGSFQ